MFWHQHVIIKYMYAYINITILLHYMQEILQYSQIPIKHMRPHLHYHVIPRAQSQTHMHIISVIHACPCNTVTPCIIQQL